MSFNNIIQALKGGAGSGNFDHKGIPGKVGGSAPGKGGDMLDSKGVTIQQGDVVEVQDRYDTWKGVVEGFSSIGDSVRVRPQGQGLEAVKLIASVNVTNLSRTHEEDVADRYRQGTSNYGHQPRVGKMPRR